VSWANHIDIRGPVGSLEGILQGPDEPPVAAAVICHAHPLHGGMMLFKVLHRVAKALEEQGIAVLRFNFRGVGRSGGTHDDGRGEQDDARAALGELEHRFHGIPLLIGGLSFGAVVSLRVGIADSRVQAMISLGYPLRMAGAPAILESLNKPSLFIQGENDEFGAGESVREAVQSLAGPVSAEIVRGSDHLFTGHLNEVHAAVREWVCTLPWIHA